MTSIKDRLAALRQQHKKTAPSFSPHTRVRIPPIQDVLPDATELVANTADLSTLRELVALHVQYSQTERDAKAQKAPVVDSIKSICEDYTLRKLTCDRNKVSYYKTTRSAISKQLLMDAGVSIETIRACTIETDSWGVRVTPPGERDEEDHDY